jgi:hypothetical protein
MTIPTINIWNNHGSLLRNLMWLFTYRESRFSEWTFLSIILMMASACLRRQVALLSSIFKVQKTTTTSMIKLKHERSRYERGLKDMGSFNNNLMRGRQS